MKRGRALALSGIVVASVLLALGFGALGYLGGVAQFEDYLLDLRQQTTITSFQSEEADPAPEIALVLFDEFAVEEWPYLSPFPREHLAHLVDVIAGAGARTIGMDVYLDLLFPQLGGDELLRDAIERAGNVVLVTPVEATDSGPVSAPPHPYFGDVAADIGTAELPAAFETFRDGTLAVRSGAGLEPSFALAMYAHARGLDIDSLLAAAWSNGRLELPGLPPEVGSIDRSWLDGTADDDDFVLPFPIQFNGPPSSADATGAPGTFPTAASGTAEFAPLMNPGIFEDKIVLLGTGFHDSDRFRTPYFPYPIPPDETTADGSEANYGWMYGVEVHANALQNLLDGNYVHRLGFAWQLLAMLLVALLAGYVSFQRGAAWGGGTLVGAWIALFIAAWWLWAGRVYLPWDPDVIGLGDPYLWVPVTVIGLCGAFSYVGSVAYVSVVEGREKRYIKGAFSMYLSPELVNEIAEDSAALQLGGSDRDLTLLFSDLAGFTSLSEDMDAQDVIALLNEYLDDMTQIVLDEKGYLDKYIGDAIMAFWNAPTAVADHPDRALRTAITMQRRMHELNKRWGEQFPGWEPLSVRIGIHSGVVAVGNVGSSNTLNYSAIGDAVNLAARLEPANKDYDTLNMVSAATLDAAEKQYRVRELDYFTVAGKDEPVKVFELLEEGGVPLVYELERALELYEEGMTTYRNRDWAGALELFEKAVEACPDDGPSKLYVQRCKENIADPPPPDWDFVVRRTKK